MARAASPHNHDGFDHDEPESKHWHSHLGVHALHGGSNRRAEPRGARLVHMVMYTARLRSTHGAWALPLPTERFRRGAHRIGAGRRPGCPRVRQEGVPGRLAAEEGEEGGARCHTRCGRPLKGRLRQQRRQLY
eukprot:7384379-Prymnesium_polylepis.2